MHSTNPVLVCFDLETTTPEPETAEIVEFGAVRVESGPESTGTSVLHRYRARKPIPPEASAVHGITDPMVADEPLFGDAPQRLAIFQGADAVITFNGERFDLPVLARCAPPGSLPRIPYCIDVFLLWQQIRSGSLAAELPDRPFDVSAYAGTLTGAVAFWLDERLDGAHSADADAHATLRVFYEIARAISAKRDAAVTVEQLAALCDKPPEGYADKGRKWRVTPEGVTCAFGKHKGELLAKLPVGYLKWMQGKDFAADTLAIVEAEIARR